jgi:hypothetical protein
MMKKRIDVVLPCGEEIGLDRDSHEGIWYLDCDVHSIEATNTNIKAIKELLDDLLANTPERYKNKSPRGLP